MHEARMVGSSLKHCPSALPGWSIDATAPGLKEYSIAQALMQRIEAEAASHGAVAVERVVVRIGDLSGVDIELLATAYLTFRDRTICARAPLEITPVRPEWRCGVCDRPLRPGVSVRCDACGGPSALRRGDEVVLDRIEMEIV